MSACIADIVTEIKQSAEDIKLTETQYLGSPSLGDVVRQGDLYLICIDKIPDGPDRIKTNDTKLAPGSTQGSRHILSGDCDIYSNIPHALYPSSLITSMDRIFTGPAFHCRSTVTVTHPEHAHIVLPENTIWQVVYQKVHAEEERRVND